MTLGVERVFQKNSVAASWDDHVTIYSGGCVIIDIFIVILLNDIHFSFVIRTMFFLFVAWPIGPFCTYFFL